MIKYRTLLRPEIIRRNEDMSGSVCELGPLNYVRFQRTEVITLMANSNEALQLHIKITPSKSRSKSK